jgi:hypothetical protein
MIAQIAPQHAQTVKMLRDWIALPAIAAENRGYPQGAEYMAQIATYRASGIEPLLWPRLAGSWPGVTFTGAPLNLPAGQFGLGHGGGAHAPDEYWVIEASNPKVAGMDGAVRSYVEFFYACAN